MYRTIRTTLPVLLCLSTLASAGTLQLGYRGKALAPLPLGAKSSIEAYYSYGTPHGSSANTGLEEAQALTLVPVIQADGVNGLLMIFDVPQDGDGGEVDLWITGLKGASLIVEDDGEFSSGDRYSYNPYTAEGHIRTQWWPCCTDGAAFRFEEELPSTLELDFALSEGLDHARILGLDPETGESLLLDQLPLSLALSLDFVSTVPDDEEDGGKDTPLTSARLHPASPNPFNPTTTLGWSLAEAGRARLEIFDILGRRVALLQDGWQQAGDYSQTFDASGLASGNYFLSLQSASGRETRTLTLVK